MPFAAGISSTFDDIVHAGKTVLHTPTLVYVFLAGAMISFGTNGIVGWGPTFVARELQLSPGEGAALLGKWGLIAGVSGTLFGGFLADWLRRRWETGRVITVGLGLLLGGPLAVWLLTIRDPELFKVGIHRRVLLPVLVQRADHRRDLRRGAARGSARRWRGRTCSSSTWPATRSRCRWWGCCRISSAWTARSCCCRWW